MYNTVKELPDWKVFVHKASEINHIPKDVLAKERMELGEDLFMQEYEVSFDRGVEGSIYGKYLDQLKLSNQITNVPYEPGIRVNTAWDIGVNDATTIFFKFIVCSSSFLSLH